MSAPLDIEPELLARERELWLKLCQSPPHPLFPLIGRHILSAADAMETSPSLVADAVLYGKFADLEDVTPERIDFDFGTSTATYCCVCSRQGAW